MPLFNPDRAQVATSVSALAAYDGAKGLVRVGTTPFEFIAVVYDATYGKWVSPEFTVGATSRVTLSATGPVAAFGLPDYKARTDAGLRLMVRLFTISNRSAGGGSTTTIDLHIDEYDGNDSTITNIDTSLLSNVHDGSLDTYVQSAWATAGTPASLAHAIVRVEATFSTAGIAENTGASVLGRWVSA